MTTLALLGIALLGFATGLRSMTPIAVVCWFIYAGRLPIPSGWASWTTHLVTAIVFTLLALGEYIGDKLPQTPNRTSPVGLVARIVFGGLVGALVAVGLKGSLPLGVLLGAIAAVLGAFIGFHLRMTATQRTGSPNWTVALAEDAITLVVAILAMRIVAA